MPDMTQPTQAQIEQQRAIELIIIREYQRAIDPTWPVFAAKAIMALAAPAQVGEKDKELMASGLDALASIGIDGHAAAVEVGRQTMAKLLECEKKLNAALTAAAQVGEQDIYTWHDRRAELSATIEHCAQVVRRYAINIGEIAETVALEIEALKD